MHRFIPVLAHRLGAQIVQIDVAHHPRLHGKSKYSLRRIPKVIYDLIKLSSSQLYRQRRHASDTIYTPGAVYRNHQEPVAIAAVV